MLARIVAEVNATSAVHMKFVIEVSVVFALCQRTTRGALSATQSSSLLLSDVFTDVPRGRYLLVSDRAWKCTVHEMPKSYCHAR
jgi:hypothetical protein